MVQQILVLFYAAFTKKSSYCTVSNPALDAKLPRNKLPRCFEYPGGWHTMAGPPQSDMLVLGTATRFKVSTAAACRGQHTRPESEPPTGVAILQAKSAGQETKNFVLLSSSDVNIYPI